MSNKEALNAQCFNEPHWKLVAKGYDVRKWYDEDVGEGTGGISSPAQVHLKRGHRYYRFSSSDKPYMAQLGGGWWIDFDTFNSIEKFSETHSLKFTYTARLFLALPYDWTRVDRIVSAILAEPIDAYAGEGKAVKTKTDKWTPVQHLKLTQLYVPGLIQNSVNKNLYQKVWSDTKVEFSHSRKAVKKSNLW